MDEWETPTAHLCKPHTGGAVTAEACFTGRSQQARRTCTSTAVIPERGAHLGLQRVSWVIYEKGKGTEQPKCVDCSLTHGQVGNQTPECVQTPFHPFLSEWTRKEAWGGRGLPTATATESVTMRDSRAPLYGFTDSSLPAWASVQAMLVFSRTLMQASVSLYTFLPFVVSLI